MNKQPTPSKACCETPTAKPVENKPRYQEKGRWDTINGMKTYLTGPEEAERAIIYIYDIFGLKPQTLEGADLLAASVSSSLVVMPDLFFGRPFEDVQDSNKRERPLAFLGSTASRSTIVPLVVSTVTKLKLEKRFPHVENWGIVGFCWGAKIVSLIVSSEEHNRFVSDERDHGAALGTEVPLFTAAAQSSPSSIEPEEAKSVLVPMAILESSGEDDRAVKQYAENLPVPEGVNRDRHIVVERFGKMRHGWMSARADLSQALVRQEYNHGYRILGDFFERQL